MGNWVIDLDNIIFTRVDVKLKNALGTKYPDLYVTNSDLNTGVAKFPTVYLHVMSGIEQGNDLDGSTINAVLYSIQLEVTSTSQTHTKEVMAELISIFKQMRFQVIAMPEFKNQNTLYRQVCRVRRVIGANDKF